MRPFWATLVSDLLCPLPALHRMSNPFPGGHELDSLGERGLVPTGERFAATGGWCEVEGRPLRDFASNDYLGLSHDPRLIAAAKVPAMEGGVGIRGEPACRRTFALACAAGIAAGQFERQKRHSSFPTGFAANAGTIAALAGRGDLVCSDRLNHASLIDGCRLSGAEFFVYDHDGWMDSKARLAAAKDVRSQADRDRRRFQHGRPVGAARGTRRHRRTLGGRSFGGRSPRHGRLRQRGPRGSASY